MCEMALAAGSLIRQGFEKFSEAGSTGSAAALDLYPILNYLPDFCVPLRAYARDLHKKERELYIGHWMNVKTAIKAGTAKVSTLFSASATTPATLTLRFSLASAWTWSKHKKLKTSPTH